MDCQSSRSKANTTTPLGLVWLPLVNFPTHTPSGVCIGHLGTPMVFHIKKGKMLDFFEFSFGGVSQKLHNLVFQILFLAPHCTRGLI